MRTTSSINFYCRPSKADKKGFSPIEVSIIINGKRVFFNLPRKEKAENYEKQLRKKSSDLNAYLTQVLNKINQAQTELLSAGIPVTSSNIREYIQNGGIKTYTLKDMFDDCYQLLYKRIGIDLNEKTYQKYLNVREEFFQTFSPETEANAIDSQMLANYYAMLNQTNKPSTTASKMTKVKTVFKYAFMAGKIKAMPFQGIHIRKPSPKIEFLTRDELNRLRAYHFDCERIEKIVDLFLFQASCGLSYGDINALEPTDVKEHNGMFYIRKNRIKTNIEYTTVVLPLGMEIWRKYDGNLPHISNQKYNTYIQEACDICGIRKNIHSHLARKTYATLMLNDGVPITTVSKMLGHTSVKMTERSYAKVLNETIFNDVAKVI